MDQNLFPKHWRHHAPGAYRRYLVERDHPSQSQKKQGQEQAARISLLDLGPRQGGAWYPALLERTPWVEGVLLPVSVTPGTDRVPAPADVQAAAQQWVATLVGLESPEALDLPPLYLPMVPEGCEPTGLSGSLACAVALLSYLLRRAPEQPVICSAELENAGVPMRIRGVGGLERKPEVCRLEGGGAAFYVCAEASSAESLLANWFGPAWRRELLQAVEASPTSLVEDAERAYSRRQYPRARVLAEAAMAVAEGHTLGLATWLAGACRLHVADEAEALKLMTRAESLLKGPRLPKDPPLRAYILEELLAYTDVALVDNGRADQAVARLEPALAHFEGLDLQQDRRACDVALQVAGTLHRALVMAGQPVRALQVQTDWQLGRADVPSQRARALGDRAEVFRRLGELDQAGEVLELARKALRHTVVDERPATKRFQDLFRVRAGLDAPSRPVEPPVWSDWPQPAEVMETLLQGLPEVLDAWMEQHTPGQTSVVVRLIFTGVAARALAHRALPAWVPPLVDGLLHDLPRCDPGVRAALEALARGDGAEWLRRCPY